MIQYKSFSNGISKRRRNITTCVFFPQGWIVKATPSWPKHSVTYSGLLISSSKSFLKTNSIAACFGLRYTVVISMEKRGVCFIFLDAQGKSDEMVESFMWALFYLTSLCFTFICSKWISAEWQIKTYSLWTLILMGVLEHSLLSAPVSLGKTASVHLMTLCR